MSPTVQALRIGIVYTKCSTCGSIEVSFNGNVLGTINTHATSTGWKIATYLPVLPAVQSGVVTLKATGGHPVYVDGLAVSRS